MTAGARGRRQRCAMTNGSRLFLEAVPGNSEAARRFRDLLDEVERERGGRGALTATQREACRTWAGLVVERDLLHVRIARGDAVDPEALGQIGDRMARQERIMGKVKPLARPHPLDRYKTSTSR